jgi:hypothetical protein
MPHRLDPEDLEKEQPLLRGLLRKLPRSFALANSPGS